VTNIYWVRAEGDCNTSTCLSTKITVNTLSTPANFCIRNITGFALVQQQRFPLTGGKSLVLLQIGFGIQEAVEALI